jgi:tetratricopeptide (TPR) repeat protein
VLDLQPDHPVAHNNLGHALAMLGRHAEAADHYQRALAINPSYAEARNNLGNVLQVLGRAKDAVAQYRQALAVQPDYAEARENLAELLAAMRFDPNEPPEKTRGLAAPSDANLLVMLGRSYWRRFEMELAASAFRAALTLDPSSIEAGSGLARTLAKMGQEVEAATLWKSLIERGMPRTEALVRLADLPVKASGIDLISELEQALKNIKNNNQRVEIAFALASALDKAGRHAEAWQHLVPATRAMSAAKKTELARYADRQRATLASLRAHSDKSLPNTAADGAPISLLILGPARSGKSTMEKLVGMLGGVKRGFENPIIESALERTLRTGGVPFDFLPQDLPAALHSTFRDLYREELARRAGPAKVFTNTNSGLVYRALLMAEVCPNVRFIFVKRNLDDTVLRIYMKPWRFNLQDHALGTARDHVVWYHQMIDLLAEKLPDITRVMRYEDIIADPTGAVRTVADWLELPMLDGLLPVLGDDRGCAQPYRKFMAATLVE